MLAIVLEESIEVLSYLLKGRVELDKENERVICGLSYLFFLPSWGWEGGAGGGGKGGLELGVTSFFCIPSGIREKYCAWPLPFDSPVVIKKYRHPFTSSYAVDMMVSNLTLQSSKLFCPHLYLLFGDIAKKSCAPLTPPSAVPRQNVTHPIHNDQPS